MENKIKGIDDRYSVLMSLYMDENETNFREAIYSMINQSIAPEEIVLVEDGPLTEGLYSVINEVKEKYPGLISSVVNEENSGLGIALQRGLNIARNEIVARMDTDDIAIENRCEKQLAFLNENKDISIVGGQIVEFRDKLSNVIGKRVVPLEDKKLKKYIKKRCPFNHVTVMFRKTDILEVGNYQDWFWNEDYYLWIRLALANKKFGNLPEDLVYVRVGVDMYKRRGGLKYYKSEKKIQHLMLDKGIITYPRYLINIIERFIVQVLLPDQFRGIVFRMFARE